MKNDASVSDENLKEWKALYARAQTHEMVGVYSKQELKLVKSLIDDFTLMQMIPVSCHDAIEDRIDRRLKRWQRAKEREERERQRIIKALAERKSVRVAPRARRMLIAPPK
jgi:hypothetical protein